ncbi:MAG TPA: addiction module toxin RelE [Desulfitobacteriaceae bacterium]|nr:addiction module toxin RelE [Desulfitobacteriaceae bacterium]
MTRRFQSTRKFEKQFKLLDLKTQKQAEKALELFISDPSHPSLRYKEIQGTDNFYEISVNRSVRIIIEVTSEENDQINTLYIIGTHDNVFPPK